MKLYGNPLLVTLFLGITPFLGIKSTHAANLPASTNKTALITGYPPFIGSIAALLDASNNSLFDANTLEPILAVGSHIYIPSQLCEASITQLQNQFSFLVAEHFTFLDADGDVCEVQPDQIQWFILEPQSGDWSDVKAWDDLIKIEISPLNYPDAFVSSNNTLPTQHTILSIPSLAKGKRIGFMYTPISQTGLPNEGQPIKVWDLNYFFKQQPSRLNQLAGENQGEKTSLVPILSAGGEVHPEPTPPEISNVTLQGQLLLDESVEVNYDFLPNTASEYLNRSLFCWGKPGTTKTLASTRDPSCLAEPISPIITMTDLQEGLEVSIRSAKEENSILVFGDIYTTDIFKHEDIYVAPKVEDVTIYYYSTESTTPPESGLIPGQKLGGSYLFVAGSNLIDTSTISWNINDDEPHEFANTTPANIVNNKLRGELPTYNVRAEDMGQTLKLTVHAKDGNDIKGNDYDLNITSPEAPTIDNLAFGGNFFVGDEIFVEYDWAMGKNGHRSDRSEFYWETPTSPNLKGQIDDSAPGNGRKSTTMDLFQTGTIATKSTNGIYVIKADDVGGTITFNLTAKDGVGRTGNNKPISHYLDKTEVSTKKPPTLSSVRLMNSTSGATQQVQNASFAYVQYIYSPGENRQATDMSEMVWYFPDGTTLFAKMNNPSRDWTMIRRTFNSVTNTVQIGEGSYSLLREDLDKIIKAEITPVDSDGVRGATHVVQNKIVYSQTDAVAPKVEHIQINVQDGGEPRLGTALYGTYNYIEGRGHGWGEDRSLYEWQGTKVISGRAQSTGRTGSYIIRLDDVGKTISLKVTAHSEVLGPIQGNTENQSVNIQEN